MHPIINFGFIQMPSYGLVILLGFIVAVPIAMTLAEKYDYHKLDILLSTILAAVGMIVFAKIFYIISLIPELIEFHDYYSSHLNSLFFLMFNGYVFYGGLIGALLGFALYAKWNNSSVLKLLNIVVPVVPLVHAFGRIGCFLGGCCYGIPYHGFGAVRFPKNDFVGDVLGSVDRFPVQLLESALNFLLFLLLYFIARKIRFDGMLLGLYLIIYPIERFFLEFLRGDAIRGKFFGVSTSQWISLMLIPIGIFLLVKKGNFKTKVMQEKNNEPSLDD